MNTDQISATPFQLMQKVCRPKLEKLLSVVDDAIVSITGDIEA